ncbi:MAG: primase C-terminal domain-containing protein [Planctomycetaceae bacterium]|nr:primase C-terminal domain-containing protein [Planctomycetaceae bacterium]
MNVIPQELKKLNIWHCWKLIGVNTKLPVQINGEPAKSNDPGTWTDYETALEASKQFTGLVLEIVDPYCGVDLDDCINDVGEVRPWAAEILERFKGVAYAEISPSKTGIKLITRARKPPSTKCKHVIHGDQQIECYDNRRFWTVTGDVINEQTEIQDGQEAINWLREEYLRIEQRPAPQRKSLPTGSALRDRARAYVDSVPYQGGGRNNAVFSLAGHLYAMSGELGERLDVAEVQDLMRYWNAKLGEPLSDRELMTATDSAGRNGTARAEKPSTQSSRCDVDVSALLKTNPPEPGGVLTLDMLEELANNEVVDQTVASQRRIDLPEDIFEKAPGWLRDMTSFQYESCMFPLRESFLSSAIVTLATILSNRIVGQRGMRTNVYVMVLAPTGGGKDFCRDVSRKVLEEVDPELLGSEDFASATAMIRALSTQPVQLWLIDEVAKMYGMIGSRHASSHQREIVPALLKLFTSSNKTNVKFRDFANSDNRIILDHPCANILGTSTDAGFWDSLQSEYITDGLLGRNLVFEDHYSLYKRTEHRDVDLSSHKDEGGLVRIPEHSLTIPDELLEIPRYWTDRSYGDGNLSHRHPTPIRMAYTKAADEHLQRQFEAIAEKRMDEDVISSSLWSRQSEKSAKLALIAAGARGSDVVQLSDAEWAVELTDALARRMIKRVRGNVAQNDHERDVQGVLKVIAEGPGALKRRSLTRKTQHLRKRDREPILDDLEQSGSIVRAIVHGKTRPAEWFGTSYRNVLNAVRTTL